MPSEEGLPINLKKWVRDAAEFWFPRGITCIGCGEDIFNARYSLCPACLNALGMISGRVCRRCGRPLAEDSTTLCYACFGKLTSFKGNVAVGAYTPMAQQLIFRYKYKDRRDLAYPMAEMMHALLASTWISDVSCVLGVPSSKKRIRQRGYCQMEVLAEILSEMSGLEHKKRVLVRSKDTPRMKKLDRDSRSTVLRGCFEVVCPEKIIGQSVLLVDDIMTTGATLEVCSQALLEAGAAEVWALTFATVYDHQPESKGIWPVKLWKRKNC